MEHTSTESLEESWYNASVRSGSVSKSSIQNLAKPMAARPQADTPPTAYWLVPGYEMTLRPLSRSVERKRSASELEGGMRMRTMVGIYRHTSNSFHLNGTASHIMVAKRGQRATYPNLYQ